MPSKKKKVLEFIYSIAMDVVTGIMYYLEAQRRKGLLIFYGYHLVKTVHI